MKNNKFYLAVFALVFLFSCTKKETIIQQYNPPSASIYGTWQTISSDPLDSGKEYWVFPNDGSHIFDQLLEDKYGFKSNPYTYVFNATDKQLFLYSGLMNYTVVNDTLTLFQSRIPMYKALKVSKPDFTPANFLTPLSILKEVKTHKSMDVFSNSVGIKGDTLIYIANLFGSVKLYKYSLNDRIHTDSQAYTSLGSVYYKTGNTYLGLSNTNFIYKGKELKSFASNSSNKLSNVIAMSLNGTSNTFYAYQSNNQLFAGTDGGAYSLLFNFNIYDTKMVVYHNSDVFLVLKENAIHKVKIFPQLQVLNSYSLPSEYTIHSISSNGADVWLEASHMQKGALFVKVNIP